ncbi:MAG TPA: hypothetical protein VNJ08_17020 [Bacteriovoracaceae bacterium]|nr:hypothetical protein [Bacteriovoracaceae bacterium]
MNKFLFSLLFSSTVFGASLSESFPAGKGANYSVKMGKDVEPVHLGLYIAGTRVDSVHVEYFMETKGLLPVQMWQQFEIVVKEKGPAEIKKGFVFTKEMKKPEIMPDNFLKGASGGIQMNDFLFADKSALEKYKIGVETIEIAAGTTKATHYRTTNNGQTVDYWISDEAKPMGLVMLTSKSDKVESQNYSLEMKSLIQNVKPRILPENAGPLTEQGKKFLAKPESMR